jgi:carbamoyl-phosphate synthase large subunit
MADAPGPECNILFTSVGRRVALIRHFQATLASLGLQGTIIGADASADAPAFQVVDAAYKICRIDDPAYIQTLVDLCARERVRLLFPLIDTDLLALSENRAAFEAVGTTAVISDPGLVRIALDKNMTYQFFASQGVATPRVFDTQRISFGDLAYPLFLKPRDGSASKGIVTIANERELRFFLDYVPKPILQEFVRGREITLDILFDCSGRVRCIVPRMRMEVRAGEVSKALIVDDARLLDEAWRVAGLLRGGRGCINMQCFAAETGEITFVEINPRFGGGVPLSLHAGADFPRWIIQMAHGRDPGDISNAYRKNVCMLRYDDAVFLDHYPQ